MAWFRSPTGLMTVRMVDVRIMRMVVAHRQMPVCVLMWLARRIIWRMLMLMMRVVRVPMFVLQRLMRMPVVMPLGQVQIHTYAHQHGSDQYLRTQCFT